MGFVVRALRLSPEDFPFLDPPILLARNDGSWVVCDRARRDQVRVMDPQSGTVLLSARQALDTLSGDALEVRPPQRATRLPSLAARILKILSEHRRSVAVLAVTTLATQAAGVLLPALTATVINQVLPTGDLQLLAVIAVTMAAAGGFHAVATVERRWAAYYLRTRLDNSLLQQMFRHVLRLPIPFFERHSSGELFERFASLRTLRSILGTETLVAVRELPMLLVPLVYLLTLEARLAALLAIPALVNVGFFVLSLPRLQALAASQRKGSPRRTARKERTLSRARTGPARLSRFITSVHGAATATQKPVRLGRMRSLGRRLGSLDEAPASL